MRPRRAVGSNMENDSRFVGPCDSVFVVCPAPGRGGQPGVNLFGHCMLAWIIGPPCAAISASPAHSRSTATGSLSRSFATIGSSVVAALAAAIEDEPLQQESPRR